MTNVQLSEAEIAAISGLLKSARESRGDNLAEAAFKIALSPSQLRAIEAGDLRPFYSTGYFLQAVERYASYLGVELPARQLPAAEPPKSMATEAPASEEAPPEASQSETRDLEVRSVTTSVVETVSPAAEESFAARSPDAIAESPASFTKRRDVSKEISETPIERESRAIPWGWVAFAIAGLIAIGVLKESLEPAAAPATIANESTASNATSGEKPSENNETPSTSSSNTSVASPSAPISAASSATTPPASSPASPASKSAPQAPLSVASGPTASASAMASTTAVSDGVLELQASTWVQIVKNNGEKTNIKAEPGQRIEFPSSATAAVVFGQPDKARLTIKGKPVNLSPFITQDSPPRGLVIISQIRD